MTLSLWPQSSFLCIPVDAYHIRTLWSQLPEAKNLPSDEKATEVTGRVWPLSYFISSPVKASQIRIVLSLLPDAIYLPSEE